MPQENPIVMTVLARKADLLPKAKPLPEEVVVLLSTAADAIDLGSPYLRMTSGEPQAMFALAILAGITAIRTPGEKTLEN